MPIYIAKVTNMNDVYKIGFSKSPMNRIHTLKLKWRKAGVDISLLVEFFPKPHKALSLERAMLKHGTKIDMPKNISGRKEFRILTVCDLEALIQYATTYVEQSHK